MKRLESSYSEEALIDLIKENPLDRNKDLEAFISLLGSTEGAYSFFLDAEWGAGKTVFVKQLKILLESMNPNLEVDASLWSSALSNGSLTSEGAPSSILPIYYNAWENDYWNDPLPSILGTIAAQFDLSSTVEADVQTSKKIASVIDLGLTTLNLPGISKVHDAFSGKDLIEAYKNRDELRCAIPEMIEAVLLERADTALLIIDELDRCRPTFAIRLLEEVKALFSSENLVILYATNCNQLKHTVSGAYGAGFDGERYLSRFYDTKVLLRKVPGVDYLSYLGFSKGTSYFDKIATEITNVYKMELRECEKFYSEIERVSPIVTNRQQSDWLLSFASADIVPIMIALKIVNSDRFDAIRETRDYTLLLEEVLHMPTSSRFLDRAVRNAFQGALSEDCSQSEIEAHRETFIKYITDLIWNPDQHSTEYSAAYDALSSTCWTLDNLRTIDSIL